MGSAIVSHKLTSRTSVHWHGILMEGNVANDGVPGLTQCTFLTVLTA